jgi:hypothetical protein
MFILILALLMSVPQQNSKVILSTGVAGAEFYLDANFVDTTDKNGTLTMENFPAGSFNYSIKKQGYKTYSGSFVLREAETKVLHPALEKIAEIKPPEARPSPEKLREAKVHKKRLQATPEPAGSTPAAETQNQRNQPPPAPAPVSPELQPPGDGTDPSSQTDESPSFPFLPVIFAAGLLGIAIWIWASRRNQADEPAPIPAQKYEEPHEAEIPESAGTAAGKMPPQFLEELRHKEELINAGFVENRRQPDQGTNEKEVVIVLPKEAFRYEEDK